MTKGLEGSVEYVRCGGCMEGGPEERYLSIGDYLVVMRGELEEAEQAFRRGVGVGECLLEVLQVGAVAAACLQQHGVVQRYVREQSNGRH